MAPSSAAINTYAVSIHGIIPVTVTMNVLAESEFEAETIAVRVAEGQLMWFLSVAFDRSERSASHYQR